MSWKRLADGSVTEEFKEYIREMNCGKTAEQLHQSAIERAQAMYDEKVRCGLSYRELGERHNMTRERARQICLKVSK